MNKLQTNICLISVTICWANEVILLKNIPSDVPEFAVVAMTNLLGAVIVAIAFFPRLKNHLSKKTLAKLAAVSVLNVGYNALLTYGLRFMNVNDGAFTFAMTIVIVPVVLIVARQHVARQTWIGTAIIFVGICVALGQNALGISPVGLAAMGGACILRAIYIVILNRLAKEADPAQVVIVMLFFVGVISAGLWAVTEPATITSISYDSTLLASVFIYSFFICGIANIFNIFPQKTASAQDTAIIYSLELVFTTIFAAVLPAMLVDPQPITAPAAAGCLLVCLGNIVSGYDFSKLRKAKGASADER